MWIRCYRRPSINVRNNRYVMFAKLSTNSFYLQRKIRALSIDCRIRRCNRSCQRIRNNIRWTSVSTTVTTNAMKWPNIWFASILSITNRPTAPHYQLSIFKFRGICQALKADSFSPKVSPLQIDVRFHREKDANSIITGRATIFISPNHCIDVEPWTMIQQKLTKEYIFFFHVIGSSMNYCFWYMCLLYCNIIW